MDLQEVLDKLEEAKEEKNWDLVQEAIEQSIGQAMSEGIVDAIEQATGEAIDQALEDELAQHIGDKYPGRHITIEVSEDGENGQISRYEPI